MAFAQDSPETKQTAGFLGNGRIAILPQTIEDLNFMGTFAQHEPGFKWCSASDLTEPF